MGLPAGIQGAVFNVSNVLIQSSVNSFGSLVVAGNTAATNLEGFVYTSMNAIYQASELYQPKYWRGKNGKDQTGALALPGGGVCGRGQYGRAGAFVYEPASGDLFRLSLK